MNSIQKLRYHIKDLLYNPTHTEWLFPVLFILDAMLCMLVIKNVPYTEIDWSSYMQQVRQYIAGERDYEFIKGDTGPLVYPGLHVYVYRVLFELTDEGKDVRRAQWIFMGVYLAGLGLAGDVYRRAKVPPWVLPLLVLSKRLHSIFLLRMFNDCFAVLFLFAAINLYQRRQWTTGTLLFSCALGVKMSVLLMLPTLGLVLLMAMGRERLMTQLMLIGQMQLLFGYQFLSTDARSYFTRAFDLSRVFMYKWTVNWRFVPESTFLSRPFAIGLLAAHLTVLAVFAFVRWIRPSGRSLFDFLQASWAMPAGPHDQQKIYRRLSPEFIATSLMTANAVGMLFARSLHYQFYSWTAWCTPLLLWKSGMHPVLGYMVWSAQEWAWNVYPSTNMSSAIVVASLGVQIGGVWWGTRKEFEGVDAYDTPTGEGVKRQPRGEPKVLDVTHEHTE
ncbi:ALG3-domain-containing protein [Pseudovirgaria hyperparasitica]|uniref:Dol-P-Man:Man(5)GlcNAc(2)-PP-Dol alpha-1,3-mannosyltransferase n=1 Tax=Pseudovirgaria hyperparasitica TaxID=470096 RepID=A0A6A6W018_9PEZI|nr:ALG3-domain-containing protein [Pseudovirgaria hyperparasitica]KAF2755436.1 ALG3-domain-containing protein [Pseudovirgaria hyperparasitica]